MVGLYLNPPDKAVVLCVDEKSQIQALERTQPMLPTGFGYIEGVTHDYQRHGTTTLFAALNVLDGAVFDTSKDRFAPTILRLARTPRAWREVVPRVPGGASVEIWVPAELSSAEHPTGLVPPGELVVFTLRLAAIDRHRTPRVARAPP